MKAATIARYGSPGVIEVRDVPTPVPGADEVLIRVHATTVNRTDCGELLHPTLIGFMSGRRSRRRIFGRGWSWRRRAVFLPMCSCGGCKSIYNGWFLFGREWWTLRCVVSGMKQRQR